MVQVALVRGWEVGVWAVVGLEMVGDLALEAVEEVTDSSVGLKQGL